MLLTSIVASLSIACSSSVPLDLTCPEGSTRTIVVSTDLRPEWHEAARWSAERWSRALGGKLTYEVRDEGDDAAPSACRVAIVHERTSDPELAAESTLYLMPLTEPRPASTVIRVTDEGEDLELARALMLHELGHALGLGHEEDRSTSSVMRRMMWRPARIGCVDVKRACALWGCSTPCAGGWWVE